MQMFRHQQLMNLDKVRGTTPVGPMCEHCSDLQARRCAVLCNALPLDAVQCSAHRPPKIELLLALKLSPDG